MMDKGLLAAVLTFILLVLAIMGILALVIIALTIRHEKERKENINSIKRKNENGTLLFKGKDLRNVGGGKRQK